MCLSGRHPLPKERVLPSIFGFLVSFLPTTIRTKQQRSIAQDYERGFEKVLVWCRLRLHAAKLNLRERLAARASANGLELICLPIGYAYRPFLSPSEHAMDLEGNQFVVEHRKSAMTCLPHHLVDQGHGAQANTQSDIVTCDIVLSA